MSVKTRGLDEALQMLERDLPHVAREVSAEFALDVAKAIAAGAQELAPVRTGKLRSSIRSRKSPDDPGFAEVYVHRSGKGDAFYWRFLEYGQGPDGVEHGFFLRARERVLGDGALADKLRRRLTARLSRL